MRQETGRGPSSSARSRRILQFIGQLLDAVCLPSTLSQLQRKTDWLGAGRYELDNVPSFHSSPPADPDLEQVCRKMVGKDLRQLLSGALHQFAQQPAPVMQAVACARALQACSFKESTVTRILWRIKRLLEDPVVLVRVLPLLISGTAALVLLANFVWSISASLISCAYEAKISQLDREVEALSQERD